MYDVTRFVYLCIFICVSRISILYWREHWYGITFVTLKPSSPLSVAPSSRQACKLLEDVSSAQFYPTVFVLVTDILDVFGGLVYHRITTKDREQGYGVRGGGGAAWGGGRFETWGECSRNAGGS